MQNWNINNLIIFFLVKYNKKIVQGVQENTVGPAD